MRRRPAIVVAAVLLATGLAVAGCTSGSSSSASGSSNRAGSADSGVGTAADKAAAAPAGASGAGVTGSSVVATNRQVVTTASALLRTKDVARAVTRVSDLVTAAGGRVDDRSQDNPSGTTSTKGGGASLTLRVPSATLTATLEKLAALGTVTHVEIRTKDVTATAVDLDARISALQTSTARLQHLLDTANTTADLVAAEAALTDRQAQLESLQAQRTTLAGQVNLATLTLTIEARIPHVVAQPGGFTGGLAAGWHALVVAGSVALVLLGALLPWVVVAAVLAALGLVGVRAIRRLRRGRQVEASS